MDTRVKFILVALPAAILGFAIEPAGPIGQVLWPHVEGPEPTGGALVALIGAGVVDALAFGVGIAFLVFGRKALARAPGASKGLATAAYLSIAWGLVSWVPHASMHQSNAADDFARLALIEYTFHATLVAAAIVLALFFVRTLGASARVEVEQPPRKPLVALR